MARPSQGAVLACVAALGLSVSGCGSDTGDNDGATTTPEPLTCPAACPANASSRITEPSGFTDNTGFADGNACCDICAVPGAVKIPPGKNGTYDWDFITMDALYIPQFCQALAEGHDFTLTNPENSTCTDSKLHLNGFQLHGLWPNYDSDWAACCQTPSPLSKEEVSGWNFSFDLQQYWVDAGVGPGCDACFNLNHEWQKHGGCFTNKPEAYFTAGLDLFKAWQGPRDASPFDYLASAMATWSLEGTFFMNSTKLQETWDIHAKSVGKPATKVLASCDYRGQTATLPNGTEVQYFSEIQWCLRRRAGLPYGVPVQASDLELVDCPGESRCTEPFAVRPGVLPPPFVAFQ